MREIKFRAYHTEKRDGQEFPRMMDWDEILNNDEEELACYFRNEFSNVSPLMQYTGMKDKNGREIYEGDILRVWEEDEHVPNHDSGGGIIDFDIIEGFSQLGVVDFKGSWFTYETKKHQKGREVNIFAPLDFTNNFEIIGNIYENPELLEAAK
ncbi:YopX family protein [Bacillus subtilis]